MLVVIRAQESGEFLRAVAYRVAALTYQARANFRRSYGLNGNLVETGDDVARRAGGRKQSKPAPGLHAVQSRRFVYGRGVR